MYIKSITESLRNDVITGKMTIEEAAVELFRAGWMNYIDVEKAKHILKIT